MNQSIDAPRHVVLAALALAIVTVMLAIGLFT
jgi:hypothetical protein